jgi:endonuclease/exonuclease/phosphatase family metal-dependent hydrolase
LDEGIVCFSPSQKAPPEPTQRSARATPISNSSALYGAVVVLRVLTWNLLHGRAVPPAGRDLLDEFAAALAGWEWDVALLQEVPPWWPSALADRLGAEQRMVMTSRNALLPVRRAVAVRWPDLIKSNGGGSNAILVRGDAVVEHRWRRLSVWPERRWVHGVRLHRAGIWVANLHGGGPVRDARRAAASALHWAAGGPAVLGGDFNIRRPALDGFVFAGGHGVDQVFARGMSPAGGVAVLDRGGLSDHVPVAVTIAPARAS